MGKNTFLGKRKWLKWLLISLCFTLFSIVLLGALFLRIVGISRPVPNNQPKRSAKEEEYFDALKTRKGWKCVSRSFYNVDEEEEARHPRMVYLDKDYAYSFYAGIEDSATFYSMPDDIEDSIASYLYNHVIDKSPKLRKIVVCFSYEEILDERSSLGHPRKKEFDVRDNRLVEVVKEKE